MVEAFREGYEGVLASMKEINESLKELARIKTLKLRLEIAKARQSSITIDFDV